MDVFKMHQTVSYLILILYLYANFVAPLHLYRVVIVVFSNQYAVVQYQVQHCTTVLYTVL